MGMHSLTPVTPEWEKDPWDVYGNQIARMRAYVETHYERERPTYGYDKARLMADRLAVSLDEDMRTCELGPAKALYQAASWDAWRVFNMIEQYAPRLEVVQALADLRRSTIRIDEHVRNGVK